ncbi:MAG: hypothetical protein AAF481_01025 [Acidobacteriota bacterium]
MLLLAAFLFGISQSASAAVFTVDSTGDAGDAVIDGVCATAGGECTLRAAIREANQTVAADTILFAIPGAGPHNISPGSLLPSIGEALTIDGYSQAGASANTNAPDAGGSNAVIQVVIDGSAVGADGLRVAGPGPALIRGLAIHSFGGIGIRVLSGVTGCVIEGNFIGIDAGGLADLGNGGDGVRFENATGRIGGFFPATRNVVAGNGGNGIRLRGAGTFGVFISGNLIGVNAAGDATLANDANGILIQQGADATLIGGADSDGRNVVSGNIQGGIRLSGVNATAIASNYVGTDVTGSVDLGNGGRGIFISGATTSTAVGRNLVSGNAGTGVEIAGAGTTGTDLEGNHIGTDAAGASALGNDGDGVAILSGATDTTVGGPEPVGTAPDGGNVISGNGGSGVRIAGVGSESNTVLGNHMGVDISGTVPLGNAGSGVLVAAGASDNVIGGVDASDANVISANGANGVNLRDDSTTGNSVWRNLIGTDESGTADLGNAENGVLVEIGASSNVIGGVDLGNVVSGNDTNGIKVINSTTTANVIQGNLVGTDVTGSVDLGNTQHGVFVTGSPGNEIGGIFPGSGNQLAGNDLTGVRIGGAASVGNLVRGNLIGLDAGGTAALPNSVIGVVIANASGSVIGGATSAERNTISGNGRDGILILGNGATGNFVLGNYIGTDTTGTTAIGNTESGIRVDGGVDNMIGDGTTGNLISGNVLNGVHFEGVGTLGNSLLGNLIGTDASGASGLGNGAAGVLVDAAVSTTAIGDSIPGAGNVIAGNSAIGISVNAGTVGTTIQGNRIGSDASGAIELPNGAGGIRLDGASALVESNWILFHPAAGVELDAGATFEVASSSNCVVHNALGVENLGGAGTTFTDNWWGVSDGPSGVGPGNGDSVSADVVFDPFLVAAPAGCPTKSADLSIEKTDGVGVVTAGQDVTYVITVMNLGPNDVVSATVVDPFPAELQNCLWDSTATGGASGNGSGAGDLMETLSLPVGSVVEYVATCMVAADAQGFLSNTASITSGVEDPSDANNSSTDDDTEVVSILEIPTVGTLGLIILVLLLGFAGFLIVGRATRGPMAS